MTQSAIEATKYWLEHIVIGHNFCPFAKKPFCNDQIRYVESNILKPDALFEQLKAEFSFLDTHPSTDTTLVIINETTTFEDYLDYLYFAERVLDDLGYSGTYQIASFHPQYIFAGVDEGDASHYTNRSPHPMLHILREGSLTKVLDVMDDPEGIPDKNIITAQTLGKEYFVKQLKRATHG